MPRPTSPDFTKTWKIHLNATLAGKVEYLLLDPVHNKPIYAARGKLLERLLENWLASVEGREPEPPPSLDELRTTAYSG